MKIKKMYQGTVPENKILNTYSDSQTDVYSCDYTNKLSNYSTEEQQIGTWINNKPLYRKVLITGAVPNTGASYTEIGISNLETVVSLKGMAFNPKTRSRVTLPYADPNEQYIIQLFTNETQVVLNTAYDQSGFSESFVIIEYTKTTN